MDRHSQVGEFVRDVVLWRRGRGEVSACVLAATVSAWLLLGCNGVGGYTLASLSSSVLLLLLSVLFLWSKAAHLLNRPEPPIPELRVSPESVHQLASMLHNGINALSSALRDVALGRADAALTRRIFMCLSGVSLLRADLPTLCCAGVVGGLTIPALYVRYQECVDGYARFAYMNLHMYEMVYERLCSRCLLSARDWLIEILKEP